MRKWLVIGLLLLGINVGSDMRRPAPTQAFQNSCGVISNPDEIGYPVDTTTFTLIQPFGRPNGRYSGQFHTGDDWIKAEGESKGQPVYAFAPGMVTYSEPTGWGRDGGVVIIQHSFPNNVVMFSLYGHMAESETVKFPARNTCIQKGDLIGVIGEPRPAPHLHFEIRNFWGSYPGPGYWEVDPTLAGWERPTAFIENWQAWLHPAHRWHTEIIDSSGPHFDNIIRSDGVTVLLDNQYLRAYNANGQALWQYRLADSVEPVGFTSLNDETILIGTTDGRVQYWSSYSGYQDQWQTGLNGLLQGPYVFGNLILLRDNLNTLHIFDTQRQAITQYSEVVAITNVAITPTLAAFLTENLELMIIAPNGSLVYRFQVEPNSAIAAMPDGNIILRNQGQLEIMTADGGRRSLGAVFSVNRTDSVMVVDSDTNIILFGINGIKRLSAIASDGSLRWETELTIETLNPQIIQANGCTLILADQTGYVVAIDRATGQVIGQVNLWGSYRNGLWLGTYSNDTILRIQLGDQVVGYDLSVLSGRSC